MEINVQTPREAPTESKNVQKKTGAKRDVNIIYV